MDNLIKEFGQYGFGGLMALGTLFFVYYLISRTIPTMIADFRASLKEVMDTHRAERESDRKHAQERHEDLLNRLGTFECRGAPD